MLGPVGGRDGAQAGQREAVRLTPLHDGADDARREKREAECITDVLALEADGRGEVVNRGYLPLVEHLDPGHRSGNGFEDGTVGLHLVRQLRRGDLLASADVRELDRHSDDEVAVIILVRAGERHVRRAHAETVEVERDVDGGLEDAHVAHEGADEGAAVVRVESGEERPRMTERGEDAVEVEFRLGGGVFRQFERGGEGLFEVLFKYADEVVVADGADGTGRDRPLAVDHAIKVGVPLASRTLLACAAIDILMRAVAIAHRPAAMSAGEDAAHQRGFDCRLLAGATRQGELDELLGAIPKVAVDERLLVSLDEFAVVGSCKARIARTAHDGHDGAGIPRLAVPARHTFGIELGGGLLGRAVFLDVEIKNPPHEWGGFGIDIELAFLGSITVRRWAAKEATHYHPTRV